MKEGVLSCMREGGIVNRVKCSGRPEETKIKVEEKTRSKELFFLQDLGTEIFREERSIGSSYWRWAVLGPNTCMVTWKKLKASLSSGVVICKTGLLGSHPADEACMLHQPSACGGCVTDSSYDYFVTHLRKAGGKGICRRETGREWFGS